MIVFAPAFPVVGKLARGAGHWYVGFSNGRSRHIATIPHKDHLIGLGAKNAGDRVGDDWLYLYKPENGPHAAEYGGF